MNPFKKFVSESARVFQIGKNLSPPHIKNSPSGKISASKPRALIFSPHPDDECIVGALPLRLLRESNWEIVNIAVTLGSEMGRRNHRMCEVMEACAFLDFDLGFAFLERIDAESRRKNRRHWIAAIEKISKFISRHKPRVIFLPHENDGHPTHVGTHFLVLDALKQLPRDFSCLVVETEFWSPMANPNLLVEVGADDLADLVAALSFHAGEVKRNAYHARLPAWMLDNVRRGAELVGGRGVAAPDFTFGTIYRLRKWSRARLAEILKNGRCLPRSENAAGLFAR